MNTYIPTTAVEPDDDDEEFGTVPTQHPRQPLTLEIPSGSSSTKTSMGPLDDNRSNPNSHLQLEVDEFVMGQALSRAQDLANGLEPPPPKHDSQERSLEKEDPAGVKAVVKLLKNLFFDGAPALLAMAEDRRLLDISLNALLRSVGQVIFSNNPASGLLIIVALAVDER